jgi:hypothetical protein
MAAATTSRRGARSMDDDNLTFETSPGVEVVSSFDQMGIKALILSPTRELASQTERVCWPLVTFSIYKCTPAWVARVSVRTSGGLSTGCMLSQEPQAESVM